MTGSSSTFGRDVAGLVCTATFSTVGFHCPVSADLAVVAGTAKVCSGDGSCVTRVDCELGSPGLDLPPAPLAGANSDAPLDSNKQNQTWNNYRRRENLHITISADSRSTFRTNSQSCSTVLTQLIITQLNYLSSA